MVGIGGQTVGKGPFWGQPGGLLVRRQVPFPGLCTQAQTGIFVAILQVDYPGEGSDNDAADAAVAILEGVYGLEIPVLGGVVCIGVWACCGVLPKLKSPRLVGTGVLRRGGLCIFGGQFVGNGGWCVCVAILTGILGPKLLQIPRRENADIFPLTVLCWGSLQ